LAKLAETIFKYSKTGIDINFINNRAVGKSLKVKQFIMRLYYPHIDGASFVRPNPRWMSSSERSRRVVGPLLEGV